MVDITTRNTAGAALSYQEGDEQIAETPKTESGAFTIDETYNRALVEFTGTTAAAATLEADATVLNALDQVDTSNARIGFRCAVYNNSNVILTLTPTGSDEINGSNTPIPIYPQATVQVWLNEGGDGWVCSEQQVNQNLFINGNLDIWQRGTTHTQTTSQNKSQTADRWQLQTVLDSGTLSMTFDQALAETHGEEVFTALHTVLTTVPAGVGNDELIAFGQAIENVEQFSGKTLTLSFKGNKTAGAGAGIIEAHAYINYGTGGSSAEHVAGVADNSLTIASGWADYTTTFTIPDLSGKTFGPKNESYLYIVFYVHAGSTRASGASLYNSSGVTAANGDAFKFARFKLEDGATSTAFSTAGANIAEELAMCQRYFYRIDGDVNEETYTARSTQADSLQCTIPLPVIMNHAGTVSMSSTLYHAVNGLTNGNVTVASSSATQSQIIVNCDWVHTAGYEAGSLRVNAGKYVEVSAEL